MVHLDIRACGAPARNSGKAAAEDGLTDERELLQLRGGVQLSGQRSQFDMILNISAAKEHSSHSAKSPACLGYSTTTETSLSRIVAQRTCTNKPRRQSCTFPHPTHDLRCSSGSIAPLRFRCPIRLFFKRRNRLICSARGTLLSNGSTCSIATTITAER